MKPTLEELVADWAKRNYVNIIAVVLRLITIYSHWH